MPVANYVRRTIVHRSTNTWQREHDTGPIFFSGRKAPIGGFELRSPHKTTVRSLGTPDKARAELLALPMVQEHKHALLAARPRIELAWRQKYKPGLHVAPDGGKIFATDGELHFLDAAGTTIRTEPNGEHEHRIINLERRLGIPYAPIQVTDAAPRPSLAVKSGDDLLVETYIAHAGTQCSSHERVSRRLAHFQNYRRQAVGEM